MIQKKRILLIEDEDDISHPLAFRLKRMGFDVAIANNGKNGLEEAKLTTPDLIILDLSLPLLSGEEVCKSIRENDEEGISQIPIIMLTAKVSEVDRIIGKVIGANSYMTKPFEIEELLKEINRFI